MHGDQDLGSEESVAVHLSKMRRPIMEEEAQNGVFDLGREW